MSTKEEKLSRSLDEIISSNIHDKPKQNTHAIPQRQNNTRGMNRTQHRRPYNGRQVQQRPVFHPYNPNFNRQPQHIRNRPHNDFQSQKSIQKSFMNVNFKPDEAASKGKFIFVTSPDDSTKKTLKVHLEEELVMEITVEGTFKFMFLLNSLKFTKELEQYLVRDLINKVLRPFHLFLIRKKIVIPTDPTEPDEEKISWYVTDGSRYKAKLLPQKPELLGPNTKGLALKRVELLESLHKNDLILTPGKFNIVESIEQDGSAAFHNPVTAFNNMCNERGWTQVKFWFVREPRNNMNGYQWVINVQDVGLTIEPKPRSWNVDMNIAKNLAAENAVSVLKKF